MIAMIVSALISLSAAWVYWDATANKIGKVPGAGGMFNLSAGAWSVVTLFLWIIGFPAYVVKRGALIERARSQPVEVRGRWIKFSILLIIGVLGVLGQSEEPQPRVVAVIKPAPVAPKVAAPSPEAPKPTPVASQPVDVLKTTLARVSELEKEVAELQRQVALKNKELAALEKAASR